MAKSMGKRIQAAAIEGRLFSKAKEYLTKKLDSSIGSLYRLLWTRKQKVNPRQILFISFQGDYTCNPKYIAEELRKRNPDYEIVWSARKASLYNQSFPEEYRLVEQYSADFYRELGRSKLVVANSVEFQELKSAKKKEQCWIETWHGSLGIKRFDAASNGGKQWVAAAKRVGRLCDYLISDSTFENEVYRNSFWPKTTILEYGHPRNDILFNRSEELRGKMLQKVLGRAKEPADGVRFVLYAPTFRDSHSTASYSVDYDRLCAALSQRFGGTWNVLVRLHPTVRENANELRYGPNVIDLSSYPDMQEIMVIADAAVTDYSSWIFDYLLTGKPGFLYATDLASYDQERGFYYPLSDTPFSIAKNNDELEADILRFDDALYRTRAEAFLKDKGCFERGDAAERTADLIETIMR
ncbi:MAG: CDP-glycerol glycerophosphotransferase family protein [Clostridia bacterium]|nr:CDP-glycerol glycerophosphotransferase family protein [Clostridia bacterium]